MFWTGKLVLVPVVPVCEMPGWDAGVVLAASGRDEDDPEPPPPAHAPSRKISARKAQASRRVPRAGGPGYGRPLV